MLLVFLWIVITHVGCVHSTTAELKDNETHFVILHTNDVHGQWTGIPQKDGRTLGGLAAQAAKIKTIRDQSVRDGASVILLSAGDVNTGTPESDLLAAEPDFKAMNEMGYDAMAMGNHELDGGIDKLVRQSSLARFPILTANVRPLKAAKKWLPPHTIIERAGVKVGIVGLTTETLKQITLTEHGRDLEVIPAVRAGELAARDLRKKGAEFVIALTHLGIRISGKKESMAIATEDRDLLTGDSSIDLVVGGHSHTLLPEGVLVNNKLIVQAGEKGQYLGRVDLVWNRTQRKIVSQKVQVIPLLASEGEDNRIKQLLADSQSKVSVFLDREVGIATEELDGERDHVRHQETNLGNFICDVIRKRTKSDIAVYNGGGIRASISKGTIRLRDLYRVLPFRNTVTTARISGALLKEALETGLRSQMIGGGFLQVSGLEYSAVDNKIDKILVKGRPLLPNQVIQIAANNFLMGGGDFLEPLTRAKDIRDTQIPVEDMVLVHLKQSPKVVPISLGRIRLAKPSD